MCVMWMDRFGFSLLVPFSTHFRMGGNKIAASIDILLISLFDLYIYSFFSSVLIVSLCITISSCSIDGNNVERGGGRRIISSSFNFFFLNENDK